MKKAVFTAVRDEGIFLDIWLKYYSSHFDGCDIHVFDHQTADGTVEAAKQKYEFNHTIWDYEVFGDMKWYCDKVCETQRMLLSDYEYVLFVEADEIVCHRNGLGHYIDTLDEDCVKCKGYEVFHRVDEEPPFDAGRSVLSQRRYWFRNSVHYDKVLLSRVPMNWHIGFHTTHNAADYGDGLLLIHLHRMDYEIALQRNRRCLTYKWPTVVEQGQSKWGFHKRLDGDAFRQWFHTQDISHIEVISNDVKKSSFFEIF